MKRSVLVIVVVVVVVAAGVVLAMRSNYGSNSSATPTPMGTNSPAASASDESAQSTNAVIIDSFAFSPASLTVKAGTKVTWTNQDSASHTVQETDGQAGPKSDTLAKGDSYSFTFATAGTYKYHCSFHSSMTGTVVVTQ